MKIIINGYEEHPDNQIQRNDLEFINCNEKECDLFITFDTLEMNKAVKVDCKEIDLPPLVIPLKNIQYYFYSGKDEVA